MQCQQPEVVENHKFWTFNSNNRIFIFATKLLKNLIRFCASQRSFFWHYSGIGIHGISGIRVLLGPIPCSERTDYYSVNSAPDSRMNEMTGIRFTPNRENMRSFGKILAGNDTLPAGRAPAA